MEVHFTPDQQQKLLRMAEAQGRPTEALVQEAVEQLFHCDEWFVREVDRGLAEADRGDFVEHADVRQMIDDQYPA